MVRSTRSLLPLLAASLAALLGGRQLAHAEPAAKNSLVIEAPDQLTLGEAREVVVRYRAPAHLGATLSVNTGTLGEPQQLREGSWQVRYTPPTARYPQVAILALVSRDGNQYVWKRMGLRGSAVVELSSDPNVSVSVKVGDAKFGPVFTDASGRAALPVIVPPGIKEAESAATDSLGNVRTQTISLDVPEIQPLLCVGPRESTQGFMIFATNARGEPAANVPLQVKATTVSITKTSAEADGVYRALFAVPDQVRPGATAHLEVSIAKSRAAASGCDIPLALEVPSSIDITLSRERFEASEDAPILIRIIPHYSGSAERASTDLELTASFGELERTNIATREPVAIEWRLPHNFNKNTAAALQVRGDANKDISLPLVTAVPKDLHLRVERERLPADGHATTMVHVDVLDAFGNPTAVEELHAESTGYMSEFRETAVGSYEAEYRAPLGKAGRDRLFVGDRVSGLRASQQLTLEDVSHRFAVAARAGYLTNFARVSAPLGILQVSYRTPWLEERLKFSALVGYYQSQASIGTSTTSQVLDVAVWALPLLARAEYVFSFGAVDVGPVLGAGMLGAQSSVESSAVGKYSDKHYVPLLAAGVNGGVALGPGRVCGEASYWAASLDADTISGNAGGMNLSVGYELPL